MRSIEASTSQPMTLVAFPQNSLAATIAHRSETAVTISRVPDMENATANVSTISTPCSCIISRAVHDKVRAMEAFRRSGGHSLAARDEAGYRGVRVEGKHAGASVAVATGSKKTRFRQVWPNLNRQSADFDKSGPFFREPS